MTWRQRIKSLFEFVRGYMHAFETNALVSHAAALAFYLFFSIPPMVLALVSILGLIPIEQWVGTTERELHDLLQGALGLVLPEESARGIAGFVWMRGREFFQQVEEFSQVDLRVRIQEFLLRALPEAPARQMGSIANDILGHSHPGLLTASFVGVLWAASAVTRSVSRALTVVYGDGKPRFMLRNLRSLLMTVLVLLAATASLVLMPILEGVVRGSVLALGLSGWVLTAWRLFARGMGLFFLFFVVLVLHRFGTRSRRPLRVLVPGSLATIALWWLLSFGFRLWASRGWEHYNATYGTLSSVIVLLLFCYLVSLALLIGAQLNAQILSYRSRWRPVPGPPAPERKGRLRRLVERADRRRRKSA